MNEQDRREIGEVIEIVREALAERTAAVLDHSSIVLTETSEAIGVPVEVIREVAITATVDNRRELIRVLDKIKVTDTTLVEGVDTSPLLQTDELDRFAVFFHPQKLHYQIDRFRNTLDIPDDLHPVVVDRIADGYILVSTHSCNGTDVPQSAAVKYWNRKYRRQIDD